MFSASASNVADTPQTKVENSIRYVSDGFGIEERQTARQEAKNENLELSFALQNKQYLGGANLRIKDSKGKNVIDTASDGPLFFAKLPKGTYSVEATVEGKSLTQVAHLPATGVARLFFAWPSKNADGSN